MKKDRIRGKFTVVNEVSVSKSLPRFFRVRNLKDRRSDLYEVRVKK